MRSRRLRASFWRSPPPHELFVTEVEFLREHVFPPRPSSLRVVSMTSLYRVPAGPSPPQNCTSRVVAFPPRLQNIAGISHLSLPAEKVLSSIWLQALSPSTCTCLSCSGVCPLLGHGTLRSPPDASPPPPPPSPLFPELPETERKTQT